MPLIIALSAFKRGVKVSSMIAERETVAASFKKMLGISLGFLT